MAPMSFRAQCVKPAEAGIVILYSKGRRRQSTTLVELHSFRQEFQPLRWRHYGRDSVSNHQPLEVYSIIYSEADQRKHQSSSSLAFVWGFHRGPVNSPHKWPVMRKMFPFDDVIMTARLLQCVSVPDDMFSWASCIVMFYTCSLDSYYFVIACNGISKSKSRIPTKEFEFERDLLCLLDIGRFTHSL